MFGNSNVHNAVDAAKIAERENKQPFLVTDRDLKHWQKDAADGIYPALPFPSLGTYVPKGYKVTGSLVLDTTAVGLEGKPTLTFRTFVGKLREGFAYAVTEAEESRVHIAEFEPVGELEAA